MIRNFRRSGQEPDLSLRSQGENAYLVLRGVFHVSPPALGGLSIDGKLTFSNNAYLKLPTEWIMLHGELAIVAWKGSNPCLTAKLRSAHLKATAHSPARHGIRRR